MPPLRSPHTTEETQSLLSVDELARELSVGRTTAYALCWEGQIPSMKIGRRRLIRRADVAEFIERRLESDG
jgi:excisionase family DNA binding protein